MLPQPPLFCGPGSHFLKRSPLSRCIPSSSPVFCVSSHFSSLHSGLRTLPSLPDLLATGTSGPDPSPLLSLFHAHPTQQPLPPPFLQHFTFTTFYSANNDFMTFPSSNRIDSSCTHSFSKYLLGSQSVLSTVPAALDPSEGKKLRPLPPAARISIPGWLVLPGAQTPPDALSPGCYSSCLSFGSFSAPSLPLPLPALDHSCLLISVDDPTTYAAFRITILTPSTSY